MITNDFNKALRSISDTLRDLGYPGYNHYDKEPKSFIARIFCKDGWIPAVLCISYHYSKLFIRLSNHNGLAFGASFLDFYLFRE
jgi:hypothetical protein